MINIKRLLKTAALFGIALSVHHKVRTRGEKIKLLKEKKRFKKIEKELKKKSKEVEELNANPPVRIPTDPYSRN